MAILRFVLAEPGGGGAEIADLDSAFDKEYEASLEDGSQGSFSLSSGSADEKKISVGQHDVKVYRGSELIGRGRIISAGRSGGDDSTRTFQFIGYKQLLDRKKIYVSDSVVGVGITGVDLEAAGWSLITMVMGRAGGSTSYNITRAGNPTGRIITGTKFFEADTSIREALDTLAQTSTSTVVDDSWEWDIVAEGDDLVYYAWYPRRGRSRYKSPEADMDTVIVSSSSSLPAKVVGMYWPKYQATLDLKSIPANVNLVYLFQAGPAAADAGSYPSGTGKIVLMGEGGNPGDYAYQPDSWWKDQVQTLRARGTIVMLSMGGAGAYVDLSTTTKAQACLDSIKDIYTRVGGIDGLDFNLETTETGTPIYTANMVWIAQQLKAAYGTQFCFSIPVAQHVTATYIQHDIDIVNALLAAGCLDFVAPQIYDGFVSMTESQKITLVNTVVNFWSTYVSWDKIGIGFRTVGATSVAMSVASAYVSYDVVANQHPELRGAFHFDAKDDAGQSWSWANTLAPRIQSSTSTLVIPAPITLLDDFTNSTTTNSLWTLSGNATVTGGGLSMTPTGYGTGPNKAVTKTSYNAQAGTTRWQVRTPPTAVGTLSAGVTIYEAFMEFNLYKTSDPTYSFINVAIFSGNGNADLQITYRNGVGDTTGTGPGGAHINYNLGYKVTDKYYRLYVANGYMLLDAAPDVSGAPGSWSTKWLAAVTDLPSMTSASIKLDSDGYGTGVVWEQVGYVSDGTEGATDTGSGTVGVVIPTEITGPVVNPVEQTNWFFDTRTNVYDFTEEYDFSNYANYITVQGGAGLNDRYTLNSKGATGGTFNLTFKGYDINSYNKGTATYAISQTTLQLWLENLPSIGQGNVLVTGPDNLNTGNHVYYIEFVGRLARRLNTTMTFTNHLTGGTGATWTKSQNGYTYTRTVFSPDFAESPYGTIEHYQYDDTLTDSTSVIERANYLIKLMGNYTPAIGIEMDSSQYQGKASFWMGDYCIVDFKGDGYKIYRTDLRISRISIREDEAGDESVSVDVEQWLPNDRTGANLARRVARAEAIAAAKNRAVRNAKAKARKAIEKKLHAAEKHEKNLRAQKAALEHYYRTHGDKHINSTGKNKFERQKINHIAEQIKASNALQKKLKGEIKKIK